MSYRLRTLLDRLTRLCTCFDSFQEFIDQNPNYTPSIYPHASQPYSKQIRHVCLAQQYDKAQAARGDSRRCYRGQSEWNQPT